MAISLRCYLFEDGGEIKRLPRRIVDGLVHGQDLMPEYANPVQRIATAVVDNENGKALGLSMPEESTGPSTKKGRLTRRCLNRSPKSCQWLVTSNVETAARSLV